MDGMLVHRRVTRSIKFAGSHLYTWVERGTVKVKRPAQEHNTMFPAIARARTAQCGVECTNHRDTAPPMPRNYQSLKQKEVRVAERRNKIWEAGTSCPCSKAIGSLISGRSQYGNTLGWNREALRPPYVTQKKDIRLSLLQGSHPHMYLHRQEDKQHWPVPS